MLPQFEKMYHDDDDELDPFEYRLLGHIRRRCGDGGQCYAGVASMAAVTRMSVQKVRDTLSSLEKSHRRIKVECRPGRAYLIIATPHENIRGTPHENDRGDIDTPHENMRGPLTKTIGDPSRKHEDTPHVFGTRKETPVKETPLRRHPEGDECSEQQLLLTADAPPAVMVFPINGRGSKTWALTVSKMAEYKEAFPGVNIEAELRKALQWTRDTPSQRKTARGMARFLFRWMSSAQDRAGPSPRSVRTSREREYDETDLPIPIVRTTPS